MNTKTYKFATKPRRLPQRSHKDPFGVARPQLMSSIRSKNTNFEIAVFKELRKRAVRFRTHNAALPGKPDIILKKTMAVIFLDSDFWHGWRYDQWKDSLNDFWRNKIETNRKRDLKNTGKLKRLGWRVLRVWEHQLGKNFDLTIDKILQFLLFHKE